jgi:hypothetical protein
VSRFFRLSILLVASVVLFVSSSVRAADPPTALESLTTACDSLLAANPALAIAELQSLVDRLASDQSPANQDLVRQVRYVLLELCSGDLRDATAQLEQLIEESGSSRADSEEPQASITARSRRGGHRSKAGHHGSSGRSSAGNRRTNGNRPGSDSRPSDGRFPSLDGKRDFSIVVLPDPQLYAAKYTKVGYTQTDWICQNVKRLQIKFAVTVGDNVDAGYVDAQFKKSVDFMSLLNNVVPYGVACGNHDLKDGKKGGYASRKFVYYYGPQRFKNYPWYGGASESGFSSFQVFTGGGYRFLTLELAVAAPMAEIQWAKSVIAAHPDTPVILTTHQMLTPNAEMGKDAAVSGPGRQTPGQVWQRLVDSSPQIFLVLCGHYHGEAHLTKMTQAGRPVNVVLQDYQKEPSGGNGWLRIFTFRPAACKIEVRTYSPTLKQFKTGPKSEFVLTYDFKGRTTFAPSPISVAE